MIHKQQLLAAHLLSGIRAVEQAFGVATFRSLQATRRGLQVNPHYPQGTPAKRHRVTDRGARKLAARKLAVEAIQAGRTVLG